MPKARDPLTTRSVLSFRDGPDGTYYKTGKEPAVHWSLLKAAFFDNIGTILTYAIFGTLFNAMAIGFSVYGVSKAGLIPGFEEDLELIHCLLFGSIISAVDPVAVIAVFDEIQVSLSARGIIPA